MAGIFHLMPTLPRGHEMTVQPSHTAIYNPTRGSCSSSEGIIEHGQSQLVAIICNAMTGTVRSLTVTSLP